MDQNGDASQNEISESSASVEQGAQTSVAPTPPATEELTPDQMFAATISEVRSSLHQFVVAVAQDFEVIYNLNGIENYWSSTLGLLEALTNYL